MQTSEKMELGMTTEEFAKMLDGRYCGEEITRDEINLAKELGFVVVYGECDDFAVLVGAVNKEIGCYGGGVLECSGLPKPINAIWCLSSGYCSWMYETELPHSKFRIYSDVKEVYCVGIVCDIGKEVAKSMTHEKVLELLNTIKYCDVDERAKVWAIDVATEAVKKQVPMKPTVQNEDEYVVNYKCPKCGCRFVSKIDGEYVAGTRCYKYCYICGQRISWEGIE